MSNVVHMPNSDVIPGDRDTRTLIANAKKYDLGKAKLVCEFNNKLPETDSKFSRERLFLSSKGQWFIVGDGGPDSRYGRQIGNTIYGTRDNIKDINRREAYRFTEQNGSPELIQEHFSDMLLEA
jgi:hypothetical protein